MGSVDNHRIGAWRAHIYVRRKHIIGPLRVRQEDAQRDLEAMRAAPSVTAVPEEEGEERGGGWRRREELERTRRRPERKRRKEEERGGWMTKEAGKE